MKGTERDTSSHGRRGIARTRARGWTTAARALLAALFGVAMMAVPALSASAVGTSAGDIPVDPSTGAVTDTSWDGPQVTKVRIVKEGSFLEVYWNEYVDEKAAIDPANFVLRNGDRTVTLRAKPADGVTDTLYFDQGNKEVAATDAKSMKYLDPNLHMSSIAYSGSIDDSKPTTLEIKGDAIHDEAGRAARDATYADVPHLSFYTKRLTSQTGIVIKSDDDVADSTLQATAGLVDAELGKATTNGIAKEMVRNHNQVAVFGAHEIAYMLPEQRYGFNKDMYVVAGLGGYQGDGFVSSISETNVLRTQGDPDPARNNNGYTNESVLIHEFAHAIKLGGLDTMKDQTLADRFYKAYAHAKATGLWGDTYAYQNSDEFFATMAAIWFNVMSESWDGTYDGVRGPVNTRDEFRQYDPETYAVFADIFPAITLPAPWDTNPNKFGLDMAKVFPPTPRQSDWLTSQNPDDFYQITSDRLADRGEIYYLERLGSAYGGGRLDVANLWGGINDLDDSLDSWKVSRTEDGIYTFASVKDAPGSETVGLTADTVTMPDADGTPQTIDRVSVEGHAYDPSDPAQQWRWQDATSTDNPYDGYLVNVKYGKAISVGFRPFNGAMPVLTDIGPDTMTWQLRDKTASMAAGDTADLYRKPDPAPAPTPSEPGKPGGQDVPAPTPGSSGSGTGATGHGGAESATGTGDGAAETASTGADVLTPLMLAAALALAGVTVVTVTLRRRA